MALTPLPIDAFLNEIQRAGRDHLNSLLTASPGAGKTTRVPPALRTQFKGKILVLEPRRMAAVAACHRICEEQGWDVGGSECGYQVRFDSRVRKDTQIIFMTDALLLRRILDDPELSGVDMVVIDEFHERNLNQDLALGHIREQQELGRDIKLLVMSATLDLPKMKRYFGECAVFDVPGQSYPLAVEYDNEPISLQLNHDFIDRTVSMVGSALRRGTGDVLVFLPGVGEIERVRERLPHAGVAVEVLHGSLDLKEQSRVLRPANTRRIVLATNVAEASVTVNGVDTVVDTGVSKVMQCNLKTGFSQLETQRISIFNADQRAGRAARQKDGLCLRMWTRFEESTQSLAPTPECQRTDLSGALLWLAFMGVTRFEQFAWLDQPPGRLLDFARRSLQWLGALDGESRITEPGRELARYPLPPRWGALLNLGRERGLGGTAARMAALLSERDGFKIPRVQTTPIECDVWHRLEILSESRRASDSVLKTAQQLEEFAGRDEAKVSVAQVQTLLLLSQGDRLCRRRPGTDRAVMVGQKGVRISSDSQVRSKEFFVALNGVDLPGSADTLVTLASGFDKSFVLEHLSSKIETREDVYFDEEKEQFFNRRGRFVFDLAIDSPALTPVKPEDVEIRLAEELCKRWTTVRERNAELKTFLQRYEFLCQFRADWPAAISEDVIQELLVQASYGEVSLRVVMEKDLTAFLRILLPNDLMAAMDKEVPGFFLAPSGVRHPIDYAEKHSAYVDLRLQEIFGLSESPKLAFGKIPLTFRLLGPNFRPVQVTSDLAGFWRTGYAEVRKELRARYPKHSWPEDGLTAKPEAKGRRRQ